MVPPLLTRRVSSVVTLPRMLPTLFPAARLLKEKESTPTAVQALLPDQVTNCKEFADVILGVDWISDCGTQLFCVDFLSSFKII